MKLPILPLSLSLIFVCLISAPAQKKKRVPSSLGETAVVIDESLSVLRMRPSLYALPIQRLRRGRRVQIVGTTHADGVMFHRVLTSRSKFGWVQSDALVGQFRGDGDERFVRLVQAADGFEQIELASAFLQIYPRSKFRAPMLLLFGDLLENVAAKLSREASTRLSRREMAASGAPMHSFYLNFRLLDRYRKLGVTFLFTESTRTFHYNGWSWSEIVNKFPNAQESPEAKKRLESLRLKL